MVRRPDGSERILSGHRLARAAPGWHARRARCSPPATRRSGCGARPEQSETLALLDSLLDTAPVGLAFLDRELRYVRINQRWLADINGVPVEETLGRTVREVLPELAPSLEPLCARCWRRASPCGTRS